MFVTLKEQYNYQTTITTTTAQCYEMDTSIAITIILILEHIDFILTFGCMCAILYTVMTFDTLD